MGPATKHRGLAFKCGLAEGPVVASVSASASAHRRMQPVSLALQSSLSLRVGIRLVPVSPPLALNTGYSEESSRAHIPPSDQQRRCVQGKRDILEQVMTKEAPKIDVDVGGVGDRLTAVCIDSTHLLRRHDMTRLRPPSSLSAAEASPSWPANRVSSSMCAA